MKWILILEMDCLIFFYLLKMENDPVAVQTTTPSFTGSLIENQPFNATLKPLTQNFAFTCVLQISSHILLVSKAISTISSSQDSQEQSPGSIPIKVKYFAD